MEENSDKSAAIIIISSFSIKVMMSVWTFLIKEIGSFMFSKTYRFHCKKKCQILHYWVKQSPCEHWGDVHFTMNVMIDL